MGKVKIDILRYRMYPYHTNKEKKVFSRLSEQCKQRHINKYNNMVQEILYGLIVVTVYFSNLSEK